MTLFFFFYQPKLPVDLTRLAVCFGWGAAEGRSGGHVYSIGDYDWGKKLRIQALGLFGLVGGEGSGAKSWTGNSFPSSQNRGEKEVPK